jgi:Arc/MetJ-type ribon-helix-helix transcriptional regulator
MPKSVTLAVRVPQEIRQQLEEKVALGAFSSLTALLRDVLTEFALDSSLRESKHGEACKQPDNTLGHVETCPVLTFARVKLCNACPYREQPVTSRVGGIDELWVNLKTRNKTT